LQNTSLAEELAGSTRFLDDSITEAYAIKSVNAQLVPDLFYARWERDNEIKAKQKVELVVRSRSFFSLAFPTFSIFVFGILTLYLLTLDPPQLQQTTQALSSQLVDLHSKHDALDATVRPPPLSLPFSLSELPQYLSSTG